LYFESICICIEILSEYLTHVSQILNLYTPGSVSLACQSPVSMHACVENLGIGGELAGWPPCYNT